MPGNRPGGNKPPTPNSNLRLALMIGTAIMAANIMFGSPKDETNDEEISYSQFEDMAEHGDFESVTVEGNKITGTDLSGKKFHTLEVDSAIRDHVPEGTELSAKAPEELSLPLRIFITWFPTMLLIGAFLFIMNKTQGTLLKKSKDSEVLERPKTRFSDVAGVEEAKYEVEEIVEFLQNPDRFHEMGAKTPKGLLLSGPPGTGKTLLAKAIAGEAGVPFFQKSGSSFIQMFVGFGAKKVRDLFNEARKNAPSIIFIDEIDAIGRKRGGGGWGGNTSEHDQTINELLTQMDGFEGNQDVIVIAATNRAEMLDPALLRPGRFDRQVVVGLPDLHGREAILKVHTKKIKADPNLDFERLARATPGFSGAQLENLANEAAIFAVRDGDDQVELKHFEKARDKILMGPERPLVMTEHERKLTAYHEAGHTLAGRYIEGNEPLHKVSIMSRGRALGVTVSLPKTDRYSVTEKELKAKLAMMLAGREAEKMIFGDEYVTTGASNDIERATEIARNMVTLWGMSNDLGAINYAGSMNGQFSQAAADPNSEQTKQIIDAEVKRIITEAEQLARKTLETHISKLHRLSDALLEQETLDDREIDDLFGDQAIHFRPPEPKRPEAQI